MKNEVAFKASTNIKSLVGKDLVTDKYSAIFELVKNAYDADATEIHIEFVNVDSTIKSNELSKLIIYDNGKGMTKDDLINKWMVIGTNSKQSTLESEKFKRIYSGDKGIGRFSTDRLGKKLSLNSKSGNTKRMFTIDFNWVDFEKYRDNISDVKLKYFDNEYYGLDTGVSLEISELRDRWTISEVEYLIENLRHFKNPFGFNHTFNIYVTAIEYSIINRKIEKHDFSEFSTLSLTAIVKDGQIKLEIKNSEGVHEETHINSYGFGDVSYTIYYFDKGAKRSFRSKMKQSVKEYGNVRVYLDNFKIHPYGELDNDWLGIDRRSLQKLFGKFFTTNDIIGYVSLSKVSNPKIKPATNRQGLIECIELEELKNCLIDFGVGVLEKYYFEILTTKSRDSYTKTKEKIELTSHELKGLAEEIKVNQPDLAKKITRIAKEVDLVRKEHDRFEKSKSEEILVYKRNAQNSVLLHGIIHNTAIKLKNSTSTINRILRNYGEEMSEGLKDQIRILSSQINDSQGYLLSARDQLLGERKKDEIKMKSFVEDYTHKYSKQFEEHSILCTSLVEDETYCNIDLRDLKTIFDNLLNNSIKSLAKKNSLNKHINIHVYNTKNKTFIRIKDNGIGIPASLRDRIFDPFFTTTQGFGMGLSIIDEIVKSYSGSLHLANIETDEFTEFIVQIGR